MSRSSSEVEEFWKTVAFFGSRTEERLSRWWPLFFVVPCILLALLSLAENEWKLDRLPLRFLQTAFEDPLIMSLIITLLLGSLAFSFWRETMIATFARSVATGLLGSDEDSIKAFVQISQGFRRRMSSAWRYVPGVVMIAVAIGPNVKYMGLMFQGEYTFVRLYFALTSITVIMFAYIVGVTFWCLINSAIWLSSFSGDSVLQIREGHHDGCSGLQEIGNCCLQSTIPLIFGVLLCAMWSNGEYFSFLSNVLSKRYLDILIPTAFVLMIVFFASACAMVFLPVRGLHNRMEKYMEERQANYSVALHSLLEEVTTALATNNKDRIKVAADKQKLVQQLDPVLLKLSTWPFDAAGLVKYGVTPALSILGTAFKYVLGKL